MPARVSHLKDAASIKNVSSSKTVASSTPTISNRPRLFVAATAIIFLLLQGWLMNRTNHGLLATTHEEEQLVIHLAASSTNYLSHQSGNDTKKKRHIFLEQQYAKQLQLELNPPYNLDAENPLVCRDTTGRRRECCASWDINADDWWIQNPDWEVVLENNTAYCLAPIQNQDKVDFLTQLHKLQWGDITSSNNHHDYLVEYCSKAETSVQSNSGFGAGIRWLLFAFWHAQYNQKPFQIEWSKRRWLYAAANDSSWAYCPSEDITCYYLPVSPCPRNVTKKGNHATRRPNRTDTQEMLQFYWMQDYMMRPRHAFRRKLYEMRTQMLHVKLQYPCTTMHIRRGDSGLPRQPYRRYAAVKEYIEKGNVQKGDNIVLLTDDESTIQEIDKYHRDDYNWIYLERPRNRGVEGGFDGHIPSNDQGFEMLSIETELRIAASCQKIVCGMSGFMESLIQRMEAEKIDFTLYWLDTRVSKAEAMKFGHKTRQRERDLFRDIAATYKNRS